MQGDLQRDAAGKPQENSFRPIDNSPFDRHLTLADLLCAWVNIRRNRRRYWKLMSNKPLASSQRPLSV